MKVREISGGAFSICQCACVRASVDGWVGAIVFHRLCFTLKDKYNSCCKMVQTNFKCEMTPFTLWVLCWSTSYVIQKQTNKQTKRVWSRFLTFEPCSVSINTAQKAHLFIRNEETYKVEVYVFWENLYSEFNVIKSFNGNFVLINLDR